jgi:sigma-B regulation protein RsbU (phosphoserine phosphatase)
MRKLPLLLFLLLLTGAWSVARAQSFDLTSGRVPMASLDGLWRFHTGDDPAWADPNFDDSKWPLLRSDESWSDQGYKDYGGMAWYRFQVIVPAGLDHVSLYFPYIETCYEVFADGKLIGTYGKMPPNRAPYTGGLRYAPYELPGSHAGEKVEIAVRVWHWPGWAMYVGGGPQFPGGLVGGTDPLKGRNKLEVASRFRSEGSNETLALLQTLACAGALALFLLRRKDREYLWFGLMMLFDAISYWVEVSQGFHIWNGNLHDFIVQMATAGAWLATIGFYRVLFGARRAWLFKMAVAAAILLVATACADSLLKQTIGVWFVALVIGASDFLLNVWVVTVVFTSARRKSPDARLLLAPVIVSSSAAFASDAVQFAQRLGWQPRFGYAWFGDFQLTLTPFPIYAGHAVDALFLLAVFAILILRFTRTRGEEERFATEVQAAQEVQQYLIPAQMPRTPGFRIESEYRPAREVGGDFFQVLPNAEDGSVLIVVGDVAGKGLQAGMLATLIVGAVRTAAAFTNDPEKILALLNERLQGRGLVTCLALRIERDGSGVLVNAGHLPPYLNGKEMAMEGALPLGVIPGANFSVLRFRLAEGDSLMLMSDGVAEAQDEKGHLFGFERVAELLSRRATATGLATAAQEFGQEDDITVLTVARLAAAA